MWKQIQYALFIYGIMLISKSLTIVQKYKGYNLEINLYIENIFTKYLKNLLVYAILLARDRKCYHISMRTKTQNKKKKQRNAIRCFFFLFTSILIYELPLSLTVCNLPTNVISKKTGRKGYNECYQNFHTFHPLPVPGCETATRIL